MRTPTSTHQPAPHPPATDVSHTQPSGPLGVVSLGAEAPAGETSVGLALDDRVPDGRGEVLVGPASTGRAEGAHSGVASGGLRLARPVVRRFTPRVDVEPPPPEWQRFMADFCAAYDLAFDLTRYTNGGGHSFAEMSQALLADLDQPLPELDAVLIAHHTPDTKVFEIAGCHLTELCPGDPVAFSVSGQGIGAPFTALRILASMRETDDLRAGAVFVLDQSSLPYQDPDTHPGGPPDRAVLLRTDPAGAILDFVDDTLVTDPTSALETLQRRFPDARIVVGWTSYQLCTSAWAALAECWPLERYTVVADYDPHTSRLFLAGLRPGEPS